MWLFIGGLNYTTLSILSFSIWEILFLVRLGCNSNVLHLVMRCFIIIHKKKHETLHKKQLCNVRWNIILRYYKKERTIATVFMCCFNNFKPWQGLVKYITSEGTVVEGLHKMSALHYTAQFWHSDWKIIFPFHKYVVEMFRLLYFMEIQTQSKN